MNKVELQDPKLQSVTLQAAALRSAVQKWLPKKDFPKENVGTAFAPANIALCKYWGKRDPLWNLPETDSLSISLPHLGATTTVCFSDHSEDETFLNGHPASVQFSKRISEFLNLFRRDPAQHFHVETQSNIPISAGLASSAAGFAALVLALDQLYAWQLEPRRLSQLARLGSGSACRSFWPGFVEWQKGVHPEGEDSHGIPLDCHWPELRVGLLILEDAAKSISSREAMGITRKTSPFYGAWQAQVPKDMATLKVAIANQNFVQLAETAEANAKALHALMLSAAPSIVYAKPQTLDTWQRIWQLRDEGLPVYFTQDAGPNLKLLFLEKDLSDITAEFPNLRIVAPFGKSLGI